MTEARKAVDIQDALALIDDEETEFDKVMRLMLDPTNIEHNTELTKNEIAAFSALMPMCEKYSLKLGARYLKHAMAQRVSLNRGGRKEWVKILSRRSENQEQQERQGLSRLFR